MAAPTTYSEWTNLLERFGNGDDTALEELSQGSFALDAGTAVRFYSRVEEAYKKRKQNWLDKFQSSFNLQNCRTEDDFEIALRNGKQNLSPLNSFACLKGLPGDLSKTLKKDLDEFVEEIRKSLKGNASKISSGREKMIFILNTFGLNIGPQAIQADKKNNKQSMKEEVKTAGRRILF